MCLHNIHNIQIHVYMIYCENNVGRNDTSYLGDMKNIVLYNTNVKIFLQCHPGIKYLMKKYYPVRSLSPFVNV